MTISPVSDKGSNAPENIENAVKVIGRSRLKRAVFVAIHTGRKQAKTVDEIADQTGEGRQQVLNAATALAHHGLCQREKHGKVVAYHKDPFFQVNRNRVTRYLDRPDTIEKLPTKRRPAGVSGTRVISVPVRRAVIQARTLTVDDIQSFIKVRKTKPGPAVTLGESKIKKGLLKIIGDRARFNDWGGERNDFLTDKLVIRGRRYTAAFALKGPGKTGILTPAKMGKNGDQIQRLARSPAQVLMVQYHGQVSDEVREQLEQFAQLKSVWEQRPIWYGIVDGGDTSRLFAAYRSYF